MGIVKAPESGLLSIMRPPPIQSDKILLAFMKVESDCRTNVVNKLGYTGILQIGQEMVDETNRICKIKGNSLRFTLSDALDSTRSVQMWYIFQNFYNPSYDLYKASKLWNPMANKHYLARIKKNISEI
jgi:hypothetical protein